MKLTRITSDRFKLKNLINTLNRIVRLSEVKFKAYKPILKVLVLVLMLFTSFGCITNSVEIGQDLARRSDAVTEQGSNYVMNTTNNIIKELPDLCVKYKENSSCVSELKNYTVNVSIQHK